MECQISSQSFLVVKSGRVLTHILQPTNDMEHSIQTLLLAGQMSTSDLQRAEAQALAALDPADVLARQAELRQQRDLMFRAERKAKRVSKIKSKAFRRIHRKEKGQAGLSLEDMEEMDKLDGGDRVTEEKARMEMTRARERVSLKHSTKGGRWSKTVGGIEGLDEERNTAVREMVARGEQLRKRIIGVDGANSADEFESDSEEDDQDASLDQIRNTAFDELASLDRKEAEARALDGPTKSKSVMNMKFMKDALVREQRKVQGSADELRRKLEGMDEAGESMEVDEEMDDNGGMSEQVQGNLGRMVFGPSVRLLLLVSFCSSQRDRSLTHRLDRVFKRLLHFRSSRRHRSQRRRNSAVLSPSLLALPRNARRSPSVDQSSLIRRRIPGSHSTKINRAEERCLAR